MALRAAFVFVAPGVDPQVHRSTVETPQVELTAVAVKNYAEAVEVCQGLVDEGIVAIELCGGFGHIGVTCLNSGMSHAKGWWSRSGVPMVTTPSTGSAAARARASSPPIDRPTRNTCSLLLRSARKCERAASIHAV